MASTHESFRSPTAVFLTATLLLLAACERSGSFGPAQASGSGTPISLSIQGDGLDSNEAARSATEALSRRFSLFGAEAHLRRAEPGHRRITLEITGRDFSDALLQELIERSGTLDFREVHPDSRELLAEVDPAIPPGWKWIASFSPDDPGFVVRNRPAVSGGIVRATPVSGPNGWELSLELNDTGGQATTAKLRMGVDQLAIVSNGDRVLSAPVVTAVIGKDIAISGLFEEEQVAVMAACLESPLPFALQLTEIEAADD